MAEQTSSTKKSYWKMSADEKNLFLSKNGLSKMQDVIIPILLPLIGFAAMLVGAVFLVISLVSRNGSMMHGIYWTIAAGVIMAIGLGVGIAFFINMAKQKKGFFISQYYAGNKSTTERYQAEIEEDLATTSSNPEDDLA